MYKVDNAVIMAAGASSRFAPLSFETPKALIDVNGEIMIERQIRQLQEAGIKDIYVVTGYKSEQFTYLRDMFEVTLVYNDAYLTRNNHSSIFAVRDIIHNTYICSADNYFQTNPFEDRVSDSYYAALYSREKTNEWCMQTDDDGNICKVDIGGENAWYMLGHSFWSEEFSRVFLDLLLNVYELPETKNMFWEDIFIRNLDKLKMKVRKYEHGEILEFDSIDELRLFDKSYILDTRSKILKQVAMQLCGTEEEMSNFSACKNSNSVADGFCFDFRGKRYGYSYLDAELRRVSSC